MDFTWFRRFERITVVIKKIDQLTDRHIHTDGSRYSNCNNANMWPIGKFQ